MVAGPSSSTVRPLLEELDGAGSVRRPAPDQLTVLAAEIRGFLVEKVVAAGGSRDPSLGLVELTLALHRVFDVEAMAPCGSIPGTRLTR